MIKYFFFNCIAIKYYFNTAPDSTNFNDYSKTKKFSQFKVK